ncbi:MAG: ABC transporter ATP-binding protein [Lachnospiraceae bacterium]|nr:ABC transporter ATP-binding protein [Lachnospiraceae bacterium]
MKPFQWFYSFVKKYQWRLLGGLMLTTIVAALALLTPYLSGAIVTQVIKEGHYERLGWMVALLIGATILRGLLRASFLMVYESTSQNVLYDMRDYVYRRLLQQDFAFYNKNRTGDLMSRQTGDMDAIRHFLAHTMYVTYENVLLFILALVMIFTVNVKLACCMILVLPISALAAAIQFKVVRPVFQRARERFSSLNSFAQENISGNRVVKAFAKEDYEKEKFDKENEGYMEAELAGARLSSIFIPIFEFVSNLLLVVLMLIGGIMVINGEMDIGKMVTVNGYLYMLSNPLRLAGWLVNDVRRLTASLDKIYATIVQEPEIRRPKHAVVKKHLEGCVEFRDVSYQAEDEDIIHHVSFTAEKGQTIGIIGATGAGKSTIVNLICRFYDVTSGQVLVDGIDVRDLDLYQLRDNIGMAMQDIFLFSDTIEGNIAYGNTQCSFEDVVRVAKIANADEFIRNETPDGYDTIVGERGMGLSGGQKQRISLARALLKNPSIIILDDTTSAVDLETESQIQNELEQVQKDTTVFIISHRISSIQHADKILVLEEGRIIEEGSHKQLMEKNGYYAMVCRHQYGDFNPKKKKKTAKSAGRGGKTDGKK